MFGFRQYHLAAWVTIVLVSLGAIGTHSASAADTTPTITWPGQVDGPKSLYLASAYLLLNGTFGNNVELVRIADAEMAPFTKTSPPIDDNTVGGSTLHAGQSTMTTTMSIHAGHVSVDMAVTSNVAYTTATDGKALGSQKSTAAAHFDVSPCPEISGVAGGTISFHFRQDTTFPDGSRSSSMSSAEGPFRIINGDDAHRVRTEVDVQVTNDSLHTAAPGSGTDPVGWGVTGPLSYALDANDHGSVGKVDESQWKGSGQFSHDDVANNPAMSSVQVFLLQLEPEVEKFWRSGKCIKLKPSEKSREVDPREKIELTVEAEHRMDQKEVKTPIKAQLTGVKSIDPKDKPVDEPAKFDFVAGEKRGDRGEIELTQTGKRGIGRETVTFTVKPTALALTVTGNYELTSSMTTSRTPIHLVMVDGRLDLQEDGTYRGEGAIKVTGRQNSPDAPIPFYVDINFSNPVMLVAKVDATDPTIVRVQITPELFVFLGTAICANGKQAPYAPTMGIDMWGTLMANRRTQLYQETVVKDSLRRGGGLVTATTSFEVTYADEPKP
jgi:hypothetical protein